jgi:hypothetical protein
MALNNLPASLQSVIQQGYLERAFRDALEAKLGFRDIADREPFPANIGETITKTRTGLLAAVTTPISAPSNTDITSGLTPQNFSVEQYVLSVAQYAANMQLNIATSRVAIDSLYLRNAKTLAEQARRSVDTIAQQALFAAYLGGNTRVITTLGSAAATIHVDDIRGFQTTLNSEGQPIAVSSSNTVNVTVGSDVYALETATADGSNISTAPGGISGTLTFTTNVTTGDGTAGNSVISAVAPTIMRPSTTSGLVMATNTSQINASTDINSGRLTIQMVLQAKAQLAANNVPVLNRTGNYVCYADPIHMTGLYADPAFQYFFRGRPDTPEYRKGAIAELLGVDIVESNMNPVQTLSGVGTVRRAVVCGQGALVEGVITSTAYEAANDVDDGALTTIVDDIGHITREPIDALKQVVTQTWSYIGGFVAPTDTTANPTTLPTATNAAYKRAVVVESL